MLYMYIKIYPYMVVIYGWKMNLQCIIICMVCALFVLFSSGFLCYKILAKRNRIPNAESTYISYNVGIDDTIEIYNYDIVNIESCVNLIRS